MPPATTGNSILDSVAAVDDNELIPIVALSESIDVRVGTILQRTGDVVEFAYFPLKGMLSLSVMIEAGVMVHTHAMGRRDAIHATPQFDLRRARCAVTAQLASKLMKIPARSWAQLLERNARARDVMARYAQSLFIRGQEALVCLAKHDVESRLCHLLVQMHHCQNGEAIPVTHQCLAELLGVRRTTVSLMARSLLNADIISYCRGRLEVNDLYALQQASCECVMQEDRSSPLDGPTASTTLAASRDARHSPESGQ